METSVVGSEPVRPLPVVAGDLALDFANTVDDPWGAARFDHLGDAPRVVGWAGLMGLLSEEQVALALADLRDHPGRAGARLRRAHALRAALEAVFGAVADGVEPPADAWRALRDPVADAVAHASLVVDGGGATLVWADDLDGVLRRVAYAAHRLLTGDQLRRVKRCAGCPWVYLDQSKNLSRRWCTMDDCGKHEKMRRYVERRAAHRAASR
jgi:predicted RNA-binding Zn ribbon-like protein